MSYQAIILIVKVYFTICLSYVLLRVLRTKEQSRLILVLLQILNIVMPYISHTCNTTSRRKGSARCSKCPDVEQNWSLMALGLLFAIGVVCFIVVGTIRDAGKQTLSSAIQKILLNYLQGEFVRLASGFSMCSFVRSRVCLRCAIKSKGCLLRQKIRSPEHYVFSEKTGPRQGCTAQKLGLGLPKPPIFNSIH